jgi:hypothetical protein
VELTVNTLYEARLSVGSGVREGLTIWKGELFVMIPRGDADGNHQTSYHLYDRGNIEKLTGKKPMSGEFARVHMDQLNPKAKNAAKAGA